MSDTIIVALLSLLGTFAGTFGGMKLISYRIEQLEIKVNQHNEVIKRTYVLEEKMNDINRRVDRLEDDDHK
jgi:hypothetical protein